MISYICDFCEKEVETDKLCHLGEDSVMGFRHACESCYNSILPISRKIRLDYVEKAKIERIRIFEEFRKTKSMFGFPKSVEIKDEDKDVASH